MHKSPIDNKLKIFITFYFQKVQTVTISVYSQQISQAFNKFQNINSSVSPSQSVKSDLYEQQPHAQPEKRKKYVHYALKHVLVASGLVLGAVIGVVSSKILMKKNNYQCPDTIFKEMSTKITSVEGGAEKQLEESLKMLKKSVVAISKRNQFKFAHLNALRSGIIGAALTAFGLWLYEKFS